MALSDPRVVFGIHSVSPYNRTTGSFYGILRVLGGSSLSLSGELIKLNGGSNKYPWAIEDGLITAEMSLKVKEYPSFLFELFLGKAPTDVTTPDADGTVSTVTDKYGTTIVDAATGLASVIVIPSTGPANLKFGKYVVKATTDDDLDIYCSSNIDFAHGTDEDFDNDLLLVGTVAIGDSGATTDVASLGLRFTAGSGTTAFTIGDTATFEVQPPLLKSMSVAIGANSDVFPEFGALVYAKKLGSGEMMEIDAHRCKGVGLPLGFEENAFSEAEVKVECFYDSTLNKVLTVRHVSPNTAI
jgi:hypothetical protein